MIEEIKIEILNGSWVEKIEFYAKFAGALRTARPAAERSARRAF